MNIIQGLDRIALVIAILAIIPGFMIGYEVHQEKGRTITPEFKMRAEQATPPIGASIPPRYNYPSIWFSILCGTLSAPISFMVVLFGLRGITRGIRWLFLWIV